MTFLLLLHIQQDFINDLHKEPFIKKASKMWATKRLRELYTISASGGHQDSTTTKGTMAKMVNKSNCT